VSAVSERERSGDRRESIVERYAGREDYLNRYSGAVDELVKQRWILPEDGPALLKRGEQEWDYATK
jgi:Alpha/beta hydrolase domain